MRHRFWLWVHRHTTAAARRAWDESPERQRQQQRDRESQERLAAKLAALDESLRELANKRAYTSFSISRKD